MLSFTPPIRYSSAIASSTSKFSQMGHEKSQLIRPKSDAVPNFRLCNVSGRKTELVEIHATNPRFHILFVPGNPGVISFYTNFLEFLYEQMEEAASITERQGVISFYTDFLESLYEQMGEAASITGKIWAPFLAIGHISHSEKDWEHGNVFTLKEQIDHKINFIQQELQELEVPLILVGHSIGSFMSLEIFKQLPEKVAYFIALYPFLAVNAKSQQQSIIKKISSKMSFSSLRFEHFCDVRPKVCFSASGSKRSRLQSNLISATVALLGFLPISVSRFIAKMSLGKSWSATAIDALCTGVLKYHTMCNVLYLAMTEFEELVKVPDWEFMRKQKNRIAFLYGDDDHWAPLYMHDEVVKQVPDAIVEVEKDGHTHSFCCTVSGSVWVARHVATLINKTIV